MTPGHATNDTLSCYQGPDGQLNNFYHSYKGVKLALGGRNVSEDDIVRVRLVPDDEGDFWCWHDFERDSYSMVWPSLILLGICFGALSGLERAEAAGRGIRARVRVEILGPDDE